MARCRFLYKDNKLLDVVSLQLFLVFSRSTPAASFCVFTVQAVACVLALIASKVAEVGGVFCLDLTCRNITHDSHFGLSHIQAVATLEVKLPNSTLAPQLGSSFVLLHWYSRHDVLH